MKSSEILKEAKQYLWDGRKPAQRGQQAYICWALESVQAASRSKICNIQETIEDRLEGSGSLKGWLHDVKRIPWRQLTQKRVQEHRRQWMDRLIREFKRKGD